MFVVFLRFSTNRGEAQSLMSAHAEWIARGMADGVFLLVGRLEPRAGGAIFAHDTTRAELEARVKQDPFVARDVVTAEILEVTCSKAEPRLGFLVAPATRSATGLR